MLTLGALVVEARAANSREEKCGTIFHPDPNPKNTLRLDFQFLVGWPGAASSHRPESEIRKLENKRCVSLGTKTFSTSHLANEDLMAWR